MKPQLPNKAARNIKNKHDKLLRLGGDLALIVLLSSVK